MKKAIKQYPQTLWSRSTADSEGPSPCPQPSTILTSFIPRYVPTLTERVRSTRLARAGPYSLHMLLVVPEQDLETYTVHTRALHLRPTTAGRKEITSDSARSA